MKNLLTRLSLYPWEKERSNWEKLCDILSWLPIGGVFFTFDKNVYTSADRAGRSWIGFFLFALGILYLIVIGLVIYLFEFVI